MLKEVSIYKWKDVSLRNSVVTHSSILLIRVSPRPALLRVQLYFFVFILVVVCYFAGGNGRLVQTEDL